MAKPMKIKNPMMMSVIPELPEDAAAAGALLTAALLDCVWAAALLTAVLLLWTTTAGATSAMVMCSVRVAALSPLSRLTSVTLTAYSPVSWKRWLGVFTRLVLSSPNDHCRRYG